MQQPNLREGDTVSGSRRLRVQRADGAGPGQERQSVSAPDQAGELGQAPDGPACLTGQDQPVAARLAELAQVAHLVGDAIRAYQHVREQVNREHQVVLAAHRSGGITVDRETAARLIAAGLHDLAGYAGGEVDLEPVPGKREMPEDDITVRAAPA
jgi:hypothetical protein